MRITKEKLDEIKKQGNKNKTNWIKVGMSTCGIAAGADEVYATLLEEKRKRNLDVVIEKCGCAGMCSVEPLVEVHVEGIPQVLYGRVDKNVAVEIIDKHVVNKCLLNDHIYNIRMN